MTSPSCIFSAHFKRLAPLLSEPPRLQRLAWLLPDACVCERQVKPGAFPRPQSLLLSLSEAAIDPPPCCLNRIRRGDRASLPGARGKQPAEALLLINSRGWKILLIWPDVGFLLLL